MLRIITALVIVALLALPLTSAAATITCPEDDSGAYFTGKTRTNESGKLMKQYKCNMYGHLFWVRS